MAGMMTYPEAKKLLPKWAKGLTQNISDHAIDSVKVASLRVAVLNELTLYRRGGSLLEPKQVEALVKFLGETR